MGPRKRWHALLGLCALAAACTQAQADNRRERGEAAEQAGALVARASDPSAKAGGSTARGASTKPNIIFFLTDTVRADRVSAYGYWRKTTPVFDRFAKENVFFTKAYAPSPWTRPSIASIFTGTYPQTHDVQKRQDVLPNEVDTLAEVLGKRGYSSLMINTNPHVTETFGLPQGFDKTVHVMPNPNDLKDGNGANVIAARLEELIPSLKAPFFLYVHIIDPHFPYEPPRADLDAIGVKTAKPNSSTRYDGEIHFADHHVGEMMRSLDRAGLMKDAVVVLTSDHGDEFHDHDNIGHGKTLFQEVVKVPMAMRLPNGLQSRVERNVSLVDLMPTLARLAGAKVPEDLDGVDLTPLLRGEESSAVELRPLFFSVDKERASYAGVLVGESKLIVSRSSGRKEVYLLDKDPKEQTPNPGDKAKLRPLRENLEFLLRSFEASVRPGLHLELACKDDEPDSQHIRMELKTSGRFVNLDQQGFEEGDRLELSADGKTLVVDAHQVAVLHTSPKNLHVQDRDQLTFELEPEEAKLSFTVLRNGKAPALTVLRQPRIRSGGWPVELSRAKLFEMTGRKLVDRRKSGVYLYARQKRPKQSAGTLSQDLTSALKSLGYLQ